MKSVLIAAFAVALGISGAAQAKIDAKPDKDALLVQLDVTESVHDQLVRVERAPMLTAGWYAAASAPPVATARSRGA